MSRLSTTVDPSNEDETNVPPIASPVSPPGSSQSSCGTKGTHPSVEYFTAQTFQHSPTQSSDDSRTWDTPPEGGTDGTPVSSLKKSPGSQRSPGPVRRRKPSRRTSSVSTESISGRGSQRSAALPRRLKHPKRRVSLPPGASFSIDAVQVASSTQYVQDDILEPNEIVELYHLFMTRWNPCVLILDPELHTLQYLVKSRLLFSVVLAIASQDYPASPGIHELLMRYSRRIAAEELFEQPYDIEKVQAFLLLSLFPNWRAPLDCNRSWLDLGLAIEFAKRLNIGQIVGTYNPNDASLSDRNVLRTWMTCRNLDTIMSLQFDKPSLLSDLVSRHREPWPANTGNGCLESIIGTLTIPLEHISSYLGRQPPQWRTYEVSSAQSVPSGEHATSTFLVDQSVIESMVSAAERTKVLARNSTSTNTEKFWLGFTDITIEYLRLMLLAKYFAMPGATRGMDLHTLAFNSATSMLRSYIGISSDLDHFKHAPGYLFTYGVLAAGIISKLSDNYGNSPETCSVMDQFIAILQQSITVGMSSVFVRLVERSRSAETDPVDTVMLAGGFPDWWKVYM